MGDAEAVMRAIDYIEDRLGDELDVSEIAAEAHLSVAQLYRAFCALAGHPVKDYVRKRTMSVAAQRLRHTDRSVEAIAWDAGFETVAAFAKSFKRLVGMTPAAYRRARTHYSFERLRLEERIDYMEAREMFERYPDVKVVRIPPGVAASGLYASSREAGIEEEAFRFAYEGLRLGEGPKARVFGRNVDLPPGDDGRPRFGYRIYALGGGSMPEPGGPFAEAPFEGGLYAVSKADAGTPGEAQANWDRLLAEWLPRSVFEPDDREPIEEFVSYGGRVVRLYAMLPVRRRLVREPVEIVRLPAQLAAFCRGEGGTAQADAERAFIARERDMRRPGRYYLSYAYGTPEGDAYWWENGVIASESEAIGGNPDDPGGIVATKRWEAGPYAACATRTYGLLTGVLERMHRWIESHDAYDPDERRQWFAAYAPAIAGDPERDAAVTIYIPVRGKETR